MKLLIGQTSTKQIHYSTEHLENVEGLAVCGCFCYRCWRSNITTATLDDIVAHSDDVFLIQQKGLTSSHHLQLFSFKYIKPYTWENYSSSLFTHVALFNQIRLLRRRTKLLLAPTNTKAPTIKIK